jgi:hypothetical protein
MSAARRHLWAASWSIAITSRAQCGYGQALAPLDGAWHGVCTAMHERGNPGSTSIQPCRRSIMTTLTLNDLSRIDELDQAASQSLHGGNACLRREPPGCHGGYEPPVGCHGGYKPPIVVRPGWGGGAPIHLGCEPTVMPYWNMPQPERVVTPL